MSTCDVQTPVSVSLFVSVQKAVRQAAWSATDDIHGRLADHVRLLRESGCIFLNH